jgi:L-lactate dehydrogenase complex protein LldF
MSATLAEFRAQAARAIGDAELQGALEGATDNLRVARDVALADVPGVEALRDQLKAIRAATLANLAHHLETFERHALDAGAHVHWARDADEANQIVTTIAHQHGVSLAVKSKSMTSEEVHLNAALIEAGVRPVETDLGEWIIQLTDQPPLHIIVPAIHKTRAQVAQLFSREVGRELPPDDIPMLTAEARRLLRKEFLAAGMGISGANMGIAETGSIVLVTNEGNGRLVTSAPPVHIAIMGIEKLVPTWDDAAVWLSLLARSATGQPLSVYTTAITGPARPGEADGPEEVHIILLDNHRSHLIGTPYEESLQCIRCGACLNVCPVYRKAGGHAYGSSYSGPIGAVISPLLFGLREFEALPHASTLCGACLDVCPVRIDLPRMLLELRADEIAERVIPWKERVIGRAAAYALAHSRLFGFAVRVARLVQRPFVRNGRLQVPRRFDIAQGRRLPALADRSFHDLWHQGEV